MSGWQIPLVAPASTDMLQSVMRDSMLIAAITGPVNSMTMFVAPLTPMLATMERMTSLAYTPAGISPVTVIRMVRGSLKAHTPLRMATSRSVEPTPAANAPNAPWVQVWESPMMMV